MKITITNYSSDWPQQFQQLKEELLGLLGDLSPTIEHIGSTSVPGLAAKPIIDIQVGVTSTAAFPKVVKLMQQSDCYIYYQCFNETMPQRRLFVRLKDKVPAGQCPLVFASEQEVPHEQINHARRAHVHVWVKDSADWLCHLAFREYLKAHPSIRQQYEALKCKLSQQNWEHGMAYNDGKNDFIKEEEQKAIQWFAKNNMD